MKTSDTAHTHTHKTHQPTKRDYDYTTEFCNRGERRSRGEDARRRGGEPKQKKEVSTKRYIV